MGGVEDTRQEVDITGCVQKDLWVTKNPMHGKINISLIFLLFGALEPYILALYRIFRLFHVIQAHHSR